MRCGCLSTFNSVGCGEGEAANYEPDGHPRCLLGESPQFAGGMATEAVESLVIIWGTRGYILWSNQTTSGEK